MNFVNVINVLYIIYILDSNIKNTRAVSIFCTGVLYLFLQRQRV